MPAVYPTKCRWCRVVLPVADGQTACSACAVRCQGCGHVLGQHRHYAGGGRNRHGSTLVWQRRQLRVAAVAGYAVHSFVVNNASLCDGTGFGHAQMRKRRFSFGVRHDHQPIDLRRWINYAALELPEAGSVVSRGDRSYGNTGTEYRARTVKAADWTKPHVHNEKARAVVAREAAGGISEQKAAWQLANKKSGLAPGNRNARSWGECCALQGVPTDWLADGPFTKQGKFTLLGNGVPLFMGRAIARAVTVAVREDR